MSEELYKAARRQLDRHLQSADNGATAFRILQTNVEAKAIYDCAVQAMIPLVARFDLTAFIDQYAGINDMRNWALLTMASRPPEFIIGGNYMHRWHILPRNAMQNVYLHKTFENDEPIFHDHPWDNVSLVLDGGYIEHMPSGDQIRLPGDLCPT